MGAVVAALALIMLAVGLNLSGLFQIGAGISGVGQSLTEKNGATGDFFTGVLAVVVATPCTAPFMGSALAFAFTSPTWLALLVFLALGLGLFARSRPGFDEWPIARLSDLLLGSLGLLFVPAGAGVVQQFGILGENGLALVALIALTTIITLLATVGTFIGVKRLMERAGS